MSFLILPSPLCEGVREKNLDFHAVVTREHHPRNRRPLSVPKNLPQNHRNSSTRWALNRKTKATATMQIQGKK
jgi:hypothetical protein